MLIVVASPTPLKGLLALIFALWATVAVAAEWQTLSGRAVGIVDGDTIDVLTPERRTRRIRMMGIDAPEKRQSFGKRAKEHLADLVLDRQVAIRWRHLDRDGRILGQVFVADRDMNALLVANGYAWWFAKYQREQQPADRGIYADAEAAARAARAGLWADPDPIAPWHWRRGKR